MNFKLGINLYGLWLSMTNDEKREFASALTINATDDAIMKEVIERNLMNGILDRLEEGELIALLEPYGFYKKEE